jgi:hypothetical protein
MTVHEVIEVCINILLMSPTSDLDTDKFPVLSRHQPTTIPSGRSARTHYRTKCRSLARMGSWEMNVRRASGYVGLFQPTTQPTRTCVLYDFRVVWQSPRSCKLL